MKKLNCVAHNIRKPQKPSPVSYKGATDYLNRNREGIVKLRRRGFTWGQIANVLQRLNVNINYNNLYQWQKTHFRQRPRNKFKINDTVKPVGKLGKKIMPTSGKVVGLNSKDKTMVIKNSSGKTFNVPQRVQMFKTIN